LKDKQRLLYERTKTKKNKGKREEEKDEVNTYKLEPSITKLVFIILKNIHFTKIYQISNLYTTSSPM